jgi:hypothetical protein
MTAIGLVSVNKTTVKMLPGSYTTVLATITDTTVSIHGEGADLTDTSGSEILRVEGSADVSLLGLRIHGGQATTGDGILCTNVGAQKTDAPPATRDSRYERRDWPPYDKLRAHRRVSVNVLEQH